MNPWRVRIGHSDQRFPTGKAAIQYIESRIKHDPLEGDAQVFLYFEDSSWRQLALWHIFRSSHPRPWAFHWTTHANPEAKAEAERAIQDSSLAPHCLG